MGCTLVLMVEAGGDGSQMAMSSAKTRALMRGVGIFMIPLTTPVEAGILVYAVTSNVCATAQGLVMKVRSRELDIDVLPPST